MDVSEVLSAAVRKEQAAVELYQKAGAQSEEPAVRELLSDLVAEERRHRALLEGLDPGTVGRFQPAERTDMKIAEYLRDVPSAPTDDLQQTLTWAMKREQEARDFYARMAEAVEPEDVRELFTRLSTMENGHKARLEELYEGMFLREG